MQYKIHTENYHNFDIFEKNKERPRAYFIPHSSSDVLKNTDFKTERYRSDRVISLSGEWQFKYYSKISSVPQLFDTEAEQFDAVTVPSTWQRSGYENPCYINSRYQFPLNPPKIPQDIPVGIYKKNFHINDTEKLYYLNFLGVCSCVDVFINGKYVGYSEGSHNTAEFDISPYLVEGENELVAAVYKWCNGSYLECQDMFRENGIFRDVFIIKENRTYIRDFQLKTGYNSDGTYSLKADFDTVNPTDETSISIKITRDNEVLIDDVIKGKTFASEYHNLRVSEWSSESPSLYEVIVALKIGDEEISAFRRYLGFKHIDIQGNVFFLNNRKIKIKGINHHESDPKTGFTVSLDTLERDVKLIKAYNCNGVRLSHYPHDPVFLTLCDMYGLYAIDEMDLEAHGVYSNPFYQRPGLISNNLKWENHFLDRAKRMYYRDRLHVSVTMWSLGNEAGGDLCQDKCYEFFKSHSDIPVHYENAVRNKRFAYDVIGNFYPAFSHLQKISDGTVKDKRFLEKPYFMSEYAHAMGVGPGSLPVYVKYIRENDNFLGGCIWEFCDHTVYDENARYKYTYGGDHGERKHDRNFCVDGMFFPDRSPSTGALTMRECYRPIISEKLSNNKYIFKNTNCFTDTCDMDIFWRLMKNGDISSSGKIDAVIPPNESKEIIVDIPCIDEENDYVLDFLYERNGEYVAREQHILKTAQNNETAKYEKPHYTIANKFVCITFRNGGSMQFDLKKGEIVSYKPYGVELINKNPTAKRKGFVPNIYRSPIDNEMFIKILWFFLGLLKAKPVHISTKIQADCEKLTFVSKYRICGIGTLAVSTVKITVDNNGTLNVQADIKRGLKLFAYSEITRFGLTFEMPKSFDNVKWYGLGDRETLPDFKAHGFLGEYRKKVREMHEKYIRPQESGNRSEVRYFEITNGSGCGIRVDAEDKLLNFNANHYTRYQLSKAHHIEDLKEENTVNVQIDGFVRGAGSNSCGPIPQKEFVVDLKKPLSFSFTLTPLKGGK